MAVADYVDGTLETPPPALTFYLHTRDFGDPYGSGWLKWPPALLSATLMARNVYHAWRDYTSAKNRTEWLNKNQTGGAKIVGLVKTYRFEQPAEMTPVERWESWQDG